ncbi:hypothetical protein FA15DRAFT_659626 [Coprinopsis marcescibilis]|uniref:Uncharacterized protein n=1 Tax=Coprinopsis marcescibilis TaxID=230819 RepID=A0A5C3KV68_COPMA|nr:hypothetical protein FA15DRAFT_659626 [Coprinopsis marcescibilis]
MSTVAAHGVEIGRTVTNRRDMAMMKGLIGEITKRLSDVDVKWDVWTDVGDRSSIYPATSQEYSHSFCPQVLLLLSNTMDTTGEASGIDSIRSVNQESTAGLEAKHSAPVPQGAGRAPRWDPRSVKKQCMICSKMLTISNLMPALGKDALPRWHKAVPGLSHSEKSYIRILSVPA